MISTPEMPRHRSTSMINRLCDDSTILQLDMEMRSRREAKHNESFARRSATRDSPSWEKQHSAKRDSPSWDKEQQETTKKTTKKKRRFVGLDLSLDGFSSPCKTLLPKTNRMATSVFQHWRCVVSDSESDVEESTPSPHRRHTINPPVKP